MISGNITNFSREITSVNEKGNLIISIESYDENEEAELISREINNIINSDKIQLKDIAIMYRQMPNPGLLSIFCHHYKYHTN